MNKKQKISNSLLSALVISAMISCAQMPPSETEVTKEESVAAPEATMAAETPAPAPAMENAAPVVEAPPADPVDPATINPNREITPGGTALYAKTPEPLTPVECAQCHSSVFQKIKENGGRHRLFCQDCHEQFHAYNPLKNNFKEIMPKCDQCHVLPHGPNQVDCLSCHVIPHTPLKVPMDDRLISSCASCHPSPAEQLATFPSAHTEQGCDACHYTHGEIPSCMDCHEPHIPDQPVEACKSCHPVHKPLQVSYGVGEEATCGACHEDVYATWSASPSKHSNVSCADCHETHGQIPDCTQCHTQPHDRKMLDKFPRCLDCHINAHNPPINK